MPGQPIAAAKEHDPKQHVARAGTAGPLEDFVGAEVMPTQIGQNAWFADRVFRPEALRDQPVAVEIGDLVPIGMLVADDLDVAE